MLNPLLSNALLPLCLSATTSTHLSVSYPFSLFPQQGPFQRRLYYHVHPPLPIYQEVRAVVVSLEHTLDIVSTSHAWRPPSLPHHLHHHSDGSAATSRSEETRVWQRVKDSPYGWELAHFHRSGGSSAPS